MRTTMFSYQRQYQGGLCAAIFDWAGTTVDYGCMAPAQVFIEAFKSKGIEITMTEARGPMGMAKRDHVAALLEMPRVQALWQEKHRKAPKEKDVDALYQAFIPLQVEVAAKYSKLIPGVKACMTTLRKKGLKIGSCTGYIREMMAPVIPEAAKQGYQPDVIVCSDETGKGRPGPWMIFENARQLNVYPMTALVKVGDTIADIDEGLNAGCWTVALAQTGNELGLNEAQVKKLSAKKLEARLVPVREKLARAGAHYVIDTLVDLANVVDDINTRLARGEKP